jgi:hypothetical protein
LALGLNSSDGEDLVFEGFAVGGRIHLHIVLLALVLDDNYIRRILVMHSDGGDRCLRTWYGVHDAKKRSAVR